MSDDGRQQKLDATQRRELIEKLENTRGNMFRTFAQVDDLLGECIVALSMDDPKAERELLAKRLWKESTASGQGTCPPSWSGHWMDWYRLRADEIIARRASNIGCIPPRKVSDA